MKKQILKKNALHTGTEQGSVIETIVTVFVLGYGLDYFAYFLRAIYFTWLETLTIDEGISHSLGYIGHLFFLVVMLFYAWAVKKDRNYILSFLHGKVGRNVKYAFFGAITGFGTMGICVLAAAVHGDLVISPSFGITIPVFLFAMIAVFIQASVEEIESRAFVFGKMNSEGVPLIAATVVSSLFFSYLHAANPGFGILPLVDLFVVGVMYALSYHYFRTIWFACTAHMMWNFTQDFIFGLPNSGKPAVASIFNSTVTGSSFFYDEVFGIEGSIMAILVDLIACCLIILIGRYIHKRTDDKLTI